LALTLKRLIAISIVSEEYAITNRGRKIYTYSLTTKGKEYSKDLLLSHSKQFIKIRKIVNKIKSLRGNKIENLSYAAKVHYLTRNKGKSSVSDIKRKGELVGWNLGENVIENSLQWLKKQNE
jgi:DNA-binding PadR family transcriptional regulator